VFLRRGVFFFVFFLLIRCSLEVVIVRPVSGETRKGGASRLLEVGEQQVGWVA
jgi:hypothetical protein